MKVRNYSFKASTRLPAEKMSEINDVKIPSMPGSCYHAVMCALAETKDKFCSWESIYKRTEKYMRQYGGDESWNKFTNKKMVKSFRQRIKDNTHTLTRSGKDCYGFRLHERGMAIYFFKDGAVLFTGGEFKPQGDEKYNVQFPDGKNLQVRYRGTTMTWKEYNRFLDAKLITPSGAILDSDGIRKSRSNATHSVAPDVSPSIKHDRVKILVTLDESYDQNTAIRLEKMGVVVTGSKNNTIECSAPSDSIDDIISDKDVMDVRMQSVREGARGHINTLGD